jgi:hypothetical protein
MKCPMLQSTKYYNGTKFIGYVLQFSNRELDEINARHEHTQKFPRLLTKETGFQKYQHKLLTKQTVVQYITHWVFS